MGPAKYQQMLLMLAGESCGAVGLLARSRADAHDAGLCGAGRLPWASTVPDDAEDAHRLGVGRVKRQLMLMMLVCWVVMLANKSVVCDVL